MKTPVCEMCLKSGILCRSCEEKVKRGEVSETVVKVSSFLLRLSGEKKQLKDVTIVDVVESPDMAVIICGKGDAPNVIGAGGQNARKLEKELGKSVKVVEEASDIKDFASGLLTPLRIVSVNTIYKDGEEIYRVTASHGRPRISPQNFSSIIKLVYGKNAEFSSE